MLPFRKMFEMFGWTVNWDDVLQTITAYGPEGDDMKMTIGSNTYECNGVKTEFDVSPLLKDCLLYTSLIAFISVIVLGASGGIRALPVSYTHLSL